MKRHNLEVMIAWLDALHRRDLDALRAALDAAVVWHGLRADLSCHGPDAVIAGFLAARDEGDDIDALELIAGPTHVVLGARGAGLQEIAGVALHGEIYNVFAITNGTITRIQDYADRADALTAAGLTGKLRRDMPAHGQP
jgi:hypothetical protein